MVEVWRMTMAEVMRRTELCAFGAYEVHVSSQDASDWEHAMP